MTWSQQPSNTNRQPPVSEANVKNELRYWLGQMPPHQLLEIIANTFAEIGDRRDQGSSIGRQRLEWKAAAKAIEAIANLLYSKSAPLK